MAHITYLLLFLTLLLNSSCETMKDYRSLHLLNALYKIHDTKTWEEAKQTCNEEGTTFYYPENAFEANIVLAYVKESRNIEHIWIGMYATTDRVFITTDGILSTQVYNKWVDNEPNNGHGNEYCVELHAGGLNDLKCSFRKPFLCKKPLDIIKGDPGPRGDQGQKGEKGDIGPKGHAGVAGRNGVQGIKGEPGLQGSQGPRGLPGIPGMIGLPGVGLIGPVGPPGMTGRPGQDGHPGESGLPGMIGLPGFEGKPGLPGYPGAKGDQGFPGVPGLPGSRGKPGTPGLPGVCPATCPVIYIDDSKIYPEGVVPELGSEERPSAAICKYIPASADKEVPAPDPYWVMEEEKFPVKCEKQTNRTCLILRHNDTKWISENRFSPLGNPPEGLWLIKSGLSLDSFNTVNQKQLQFLKEQSSSVNQVVRVYFLHTTFEHLQLRMLNAFDVPIDQNPSASTPMYYFIYEDDQDNSVEVNGETWKYVDLVVIDDAKRLPVVDFHVNYVSQADACISIQLRELCFG